MSVAVSARATGLLREFNEAGVLAVADVQVARRLGALAGEDDDAVLLAVALTVRNTRLGSVVLDLASAPVTTTVDADENLETPVDVAALAWPAPERWTAACERSPLVTGSAGETALRMVGTRLWLQRYWQQEAQVAAELLRRSSDRPADLDAPRLAADVAELCSTDRDGDQAQAVLLAAGSRVSVIAGGPGTGKTTTVARLLTVLLRQLGPKVRVALAAPTGKAAARLEEAVHGAAEQSSASDRAMLARLSASTLHRLLGSRPGVRSRFAHDEENRLPVDVLVVDESSMVPLTMMSRLLEALPPAARLVLVGDPDQLASVEAGAVLGDIVDSAAALEEAAPGAAGAPGAPALVRSVATLRTVHRFAVGTEILAVAELVRAGAAETALERLRAQPSGVRFDEVEDAATLDPALAAALADRLVASERAMIAAARSGDADAALRALDEHRLVCAHRTGPRGVRHWADAVEQRLALAGDVPARFDGRYAGQPLLVTANDYEIGLLNGDSGVVVEVDGDLQAVFRRGGRPHPVALSRLAAVRPLHAMTVHRSQGSQFREVTVLLPLPDSPLATRQTFYTAITRAQSGVRVIGSAASVLTCIERRAARATGLRDRLAGTLPED